MIREPTDLSSGSRCGIVSMISLAEYVGTGLIFIYDAKVAKKAKKSPAEIPIGFIFVPGFVSGWI